MAKDEKSLNERILASELRTKTLKLKQAKSEIKDLQTRLDKVESTIASDFDVKSKELGRKVVTITMKDGSESRYIRANDFSDFVSTFLSEHKVNQFSLVFALAPTSAIFLSYFLGKSEPLFASFCG